MLACSWCSCSIFSSTSASWDNARDRAVLSSELPSMARLLANWAVFSASSGEQDKGQEMGLAAPGAPQVQPLELPFHSSRRYQLEEPALAQSELAVSSHEEKGSSQAGRQAQLCRSQNRKENIPKPRGCLKKNKVISAQICYSSLQSHEDRLRELGLIRLENAPGRPQNPCQHLKGLQESQRETWDKGNRTRGNGFPLTEGGDR